MTTELTERKRAFVADLVDAVSPDEPELAKPWYDIGVRCVWEYERNRDKWQLLDPWLFENYQDNFINPNYVVNQSTEIRKILREKGIELVWIPGPGRGEIYKTSNPTVIAKQLEMAERQALSRIDSHNEAVEQQRKRHASLGNTPTINYDRQLPSRSS